MHLALPSVMAAASCVCARRAVSPRVCVTAMNMAELTEVGAREKKVKVNERERERVLWRAPSGLTEDVAQA